MPPFDAPSDQARLLAIARTYCKLAVGSGFMNSTPPLPWLNSYGLFSIIISVNLVLMPSPSTRLKVGLQCGDGYVQNNQL